MECGPGRWGCGGGQRSAQVQPTVPHPAHTRAHSQTQPHTNKRTHTSKGAHRRKHMGINTCTHTCTQIYTQAHKHTHTHTHTHTDVHTSIHSNVHYLHSREPNTKNNTTKHAISQQLLTIMLSNRTFQHSINERLPAQWSPTPAPVPCCAAASRACLRAYPWTTAIKSGTSG
jgi:hypothetical protein